MSNPDLQEKLSAAIGKSSVEITYFAGDVCRLVWPLTQGDFSAGQKLKERIFRALYADGGIVCAPLCLMASVNPRLDDERRLLEIRTGITTVVNAFEKLNTFCGIEERLLPRYAACCTQLFSRNYFEQHVPRRLRGKDKKLAEFRMRAIAAVCEIVRTFLRSFGHRVDRAMLIVGDRSEARVKKGPLIVAPAMKDVVCLADPELDLVLLYSADRIHHDSFKIPHEKNKVWGFIRQLVEDCDENGYVKLSKDYGSHFRNRDKETGVAIDDGLERFGRHIHPSPNRDGTYRLMRIEKPRQIHDK